MRTHSFLALLFLLVFSNVSQAGLKIYYIRHGEGGHNVVKEWQSTPKEQWPSYVGNPNQFTPKGETQVAAVAGKLKPYTFDFIAVSPLWRTRHTILPYLQANQLKGEIWPELAEFGGPGMALIGTPNLPTPEADLFTGSAIQIPGEETSAFALHETSKKEFKLPKEGPQAAANLQVILGSVITRIQKQFGHSDKSILLVGHGNSGRALLTLLTKNPALAKVSIKNTGIWMVEEQADGSFKLMLLNDEPPKL